MNASTRLTDIPELKACVDYLMYRYTDDGRPVRNDENEAAQLP